MNFNRTLRAHLFLVGALLLAGVSGWRFRNQWNAEPLFPSPGVTKMVMLSEYHAPLKGTAGDTEIYFFESGKPGGTVLVCGGTHPNEPAAFIAAVTILENLQVQEGRVIVVPRTNKTGFMHNESQDGAVQTYRIPTANGDRIFRHGSRLTIPVKQWPDPTIYINPEGPFWQDMVAACPDCYIGNPGPGKQTISGVDSRNLNRVYPGDPKGTLTEQIGFAMMTMIREEKVNLAIDLHEAAPEYPTINVMVSHQKTKDMTSWAELLLSEDEVQISTDSSTINLRGLSHREWGDASQTHSVLFESANIAQGRLKGRTSEDQITKGLDMAYIRVQRIQNKLNARLAEDAKRLEAAGKPVTERSRKIVHVDIPEEGIPIERRAGRHVQAVFRLVEAYNESGEGEPVVMAALPSYSQLNEKKVGAFLHGPKGEKPSDSGELAHAGSEE